MRVSIKNKILLWIIAIVLLLVSIALLWQARFINNNAKIKYNVDLVHQVDSILPIDTYKGEKLLKQFLPQDSSKVSNEDLAYMYIFKLNILLYKNQTDSLPYYVSKALSYTNDLSNEDLQSRLNYSLGKYYMVIGDYPNSLMYSLKGLSLVKDNDIKLIDLYYNLGAMYFEMNEFDNAIVYFNKVYQVAEKINDKKRIAIANGNLGGAYLIKGDYPKAKEFLTKSKLYFIENKDTLNIIRVYTTLSKLELKQNNYISATEYLNKAEAVCDATTNKALLGLVYQHLGNLYLAQKQYNNSKQFYSKALDISNKKQIPRDQMNALFGLRDVNVAVGNYKDAFVQQSLFHQLRDSVYGVKMREKMEEIKWSNKLEEQRIQNKLLQGKYDAEQQRKSILTILYLIVIISIIVFATLLYMNSKKSLRISMLTNEKLQEKVLAEQQLKEIQEQQFQQELEVKNQELIALNILILAKNKIFSEVENIIEKEDNEQVISELKSKVRSNKNQEKDWGKFKVIFEKTHPSFYHTIDEKYPQLSKTEIRICSYIKIAMPKAEICAMMNINHSSLIKSRYRIRKKLNLESSDDLDEFIRSW